MNNYIVKAFNEKEAVVHFYRINLMLCNMVFF